jgi:hypothetical protein
MEAGVPAQPGGGRVVYRRREGIARAWHGVRGVWKEYRLEPENAQPIGADVVAVGRVIARGIASGLELDSGWSALGSFRDGLTIRGHGIGLTERKRSKPRGSGTRR